MNKFIKFLQSNPTQNRGIRYMVSKGWQYEQLDGLYWFTKYETIGENRRKMAYCYTDAYEITNHER